MDEKWKLRLVELLVVGVIILLGIFIMSLFLKKFPNFFYRDKPEGLCSASLVDKPNWVSSIINIKDQHYVSPLPITPLANITKCIFNMDPKAYVITNIGYIEGFHRTKFFGFTDWFCIKEDGNVTASATIGYSDMGYNRKWVEELRNKLKNYDCY